MVARRPYSSRDTRKSSRASAVTTSCCHENATVFSTDHSVTGDASAMRLRKAWSSSPGSAASALETSDSDGMNAIVNSGDAS